MKTFASAILALLLSSISLQAQQLTGTYGLRDDSGRVILPQIYDEVRPLEEGWDVFLYREGKKYGLYNAYDSTLYPCEYDSVYADEDGFIIRKGDRFGYVVRQERPKYAYKVFAPAYSYVSFGEYTVCLGKDSLYGLVSDGIKAEVRVPFIAPYPVQYGHGKRYYCRMPGGRMMILRQDETAGKWNQVIVGPGVVFTRDFFVDEAGAWDTLVVYDNHNGRRLSSYPPLGYAADRRFNATGKYVEIEQVRGMTKHVTWYDPRTGSSFLSLDIPAGQELRCVSPWKERDLEDSLNVYTVTEYKHKDIYTFYGVLSRYTFTAYPEPREMKIRTWGIFVDAGSKGSSPLFWWSGR